MMDDPVCDFENFAVVFLEVAMINNLMETNYENDDNDENDDNVENDDNDENSYIPYSSHRVYYASHEDYEDTTRFSSNYASHEDYEDITRFSSNYSDRETTSTAAVFLLVNAALGAGLLNFPQAYDQAGGIYVALLVQLVLVCCACLGLLMLAHASSPDELTLPHTMALTCGTMGSLVSCLLIALYCFGTCITFLIIIGDQFDRVFQSLVGPSFCHSFYMNRQFTITASALVFILPMCYSRTIDFLKYTSYLGVLAVLYVVGLVVVQYYTADIGPVSIKTAPDHWTDIFYVVPVICFGYQCHVSAVPIYSCMEDRRIGTFTVVVVVTLILCTSVYTLTGVYGYLTFGHDVSTDILEDYGGTSVTVLVGIGAIAVKTITTYPILLFCGREALTKIWCIYIDYIDDFEPFTQWRERCRRILISTIWFVATIYLAVNSPGIGIVIDALGSLAVVFIFILPGLCLLQKSLESPNNCLRTGFSVVFVAFGAFIFGVVLVQTIQRMLSGKAVPTYLCI